MTETAVALQPAGFYDDPERPKALRWWTGSEWGAPTPEDRQTALAIRIAHWVKLGYRVESQSPEQAIMVTGHRPNHVLHLLLSIFTLGLWLIVWLIVAIASGEKRKTVTVGTDGRLAES